ncbi:phosphoinositide-3-kinase, regulatory subunit 4, partial [Lecanoromycetidae sp. Uapishka_2]
MGQTFSLATLSAGSAGIDVPELADLTYEKSLGTARFMKSIRARNQHGLVVVKLVMKPFPQLDLGPYVKAIRSERDLLNDVPNALPYQRVFETKDIEKKWLAYQLLCALRDSHARNVYHGDIKTENVLVTSWNWLYLTDYSSAFKKTYLPEDNPADFSYYFDTSGRRTCYLAPERFLGEGDKDDGRGVTWAMDVFSVGCVIAELFLEAPIFSLSQLYKYRKGEFDPQYGYLSKIQDKDVRELVSHMIQLEPESRYSAEEYLNFWRRKAFPEYFYSFLHQYMGLITDPSSGRSAVLPESENFGEADDRIDRVFYDFDKISYFLGYDNEMAHNSEGPDFQAGSEGLIPLQVDIPNNRHEATSVGRRPVDDGSLIFLTLVVSSLRNTARSTARVRACDLMIAFAERVTDEAKLDRILPYVVALLNDRADIVKVAAVRTLTQLTIVGVATFVGGTSLEEFILPLMIQALTDPEDFVVEKVLSSFASMAELGLFQRSKTWEMVDIVARFTMHPNIWIREAAVHFISASTEYLSIADLHCIVSPLLEPYLKSPIIEFAEVNLLDSMKRPLARQSLETAASWAVKAESGLFWKSVQQQRTFSFGSPEQALPTISSKELRPNALSKIAKSNEDEQWIKRLQIHGMGPDDEFKLLVLREYIWRIAHKRPKADPDSPASPLTSILRLKEMKVTPHTIFFETQRRKSKSRRQNSHGEHRALPMKKDPEAEPHTIADALLDASTTIDDSLSQRKKSYANARKERLIGGLEPRPIQVISRRANAFGKVDGPFTREPSEARSDDRTTNMDEKRDSTSANYSGHTYDGNDPSVLRLLDSLASENYPHDLYDFGPMVTPVWTKSQTMNKADFQKTDRPWRPEGTLIATFGEHTGPINRVLPSPDHAFFITGSDDGTVKVWDTLRLERNLAHRSRQTHGHTDGARVKCLCFVENTHTFVAGATDGSINVVKVDYHLVGDTSKYGKLRVVREYQLANDEHAVWMSHWRSDINSVLLVATNTSRVLALDLRNMSVLYTFQNPVHHGTPTCFYVDRNHTWLLLGTSHGVLDLWDLRFKLRLKAWGLGGGTPIHRLVKYPFKAGHKWICVAGGTGQTDITIWDVEKVECLQVYRAGVVRSGSKENLKIYEPWKVDEEKSEGMLGRFATAIDPSGGGNGVPDRGIRALAIGVNSPDEKGEGRHGFFITGGVDRKLRFWDTARPEASMVISGLDAEEDQPKFSTSQPTASLTINTERVAHQAPSAPNAAAGASPGKKSSVKQPRSTIISVQQQQLLRSHLDSILDVCILESPVGMTVSVDRMGCVYVFQ